MAMTNGWDSFQKLVGQWSTMPMNRDFQSKMIEAYQNKFRGKNTIIPLVSLHYSFCIEQFCKSEQMTYYQRPAYFNASKFIAFHRFINLVDYDQKDTRQYMKSFRDLPESIRVFWNQF